MILRIFLSLVFVVAGFLKLRDPLAFADGISSFQLIPGWLVNPLAMSVPLFEIFTGMGFLARSTRGAAALAACGLSTGFVVFHLSALVRGIDVSCACFGKWELLSLPVWLGSLRAILLLVACVWACRVSPDSPTPSLKMVEESSPHAD
ncbi:MAG: hypothetical protein IAE94_15215 [Chthoniobacterales bacterium]|nr:hypothetical protein [Chthoniobacterales bacterium]